MNKLTKQQRKNCRILATKILPEVPDKQFAMRTWGDKRGCGTVGCALGWAAMSGRIDGLAYCAKDLCDVVWFTSLAQMRRARELVTFPVVNGEREDWDGVGPALFGEETHEYVFLDIGKSKADVVADLLKLSRGESLS